MRDEVAVSTARHREELKMSAKPPRLPHVARQAPAPTKPGFVSCLLGCLPAAVPPMAAVLLDTVGCDSLLMMLAVAFVPIGFALTAWKSLRRGYPYEEVGIALILVNATGGALGLLGGTLVKMMS